MRSAKWAALGACLGWALAGPSKPASAQAASKVIVVGSACDEGKCPDAPPQVYSCLASALTPDPVLHGRLYGALRGLERDPMQEEVESFQRMVDRTTCGAKDYRLHLAALHAIIDRTPFLGRTVVTTGLLIKDQGSSGFIRVQLPDGRYPWVIDPAGVDQSLIGSPVTLRGVTIGPQRLRAVSIVRVAGTPELLAPVSKGKFIWCRTSGGTADPEYASTVFPGDYMQEREMAAAFDQYLFRTYGYRARGSVICLFDDYINNAFLKLRSRNSEARGNNRTVVETGWRYQP